MAQGIDVFTAYQNVTSWSAVKDSGIEFVYVKISDGTSVKNEGGYIEGARAAGLKTGGYHYAEPGDPVAQANVFIDAVEAHGKTDLAPALDLEAPFTPGDYAANFAVAFLHQVSLRGHTPCLYGSDSMLAVITPRVRTMVPDVLVWDARYGAAPNTAHTLWQNSDAGHVPGIAGAVDLDTGTIPLDTGKQADDLTPQQAQELHALFQAMFYGSTSAGTTYPGLLAIEAETQRRVTGVAADAEKAAAVATVNQTKLNALADAVGKLHTAGLTDAQVTAIGQSLAATLGTGVAKALGAALTKGTA